MCIRDRYQRRVHGQDDERGEGLNLNLEGGWGGSETEAGPTELQPQTSYEFPLPNSSKPSLPTSLPPQNNTPVHASESAIRIFYENNKTSEGEATFLATPSSSRRSLNRENLEKLDIGSATPGSKTRSLKPGSDVKKGLQSNFSQSIQKENNADEIAPTVFGKTPRGSVNLADPLGLHKALLIRRPSGIIQPAGLSNNHKAKFGLLQDSKELTISQTHPHKTSNSLDECIEDFIQKNAPDELSESVRVLIRNEMRDHLETLILKHKGKENTGAESGTLRRYSQSNLIESQLQKNQLTPQLSRRPLLLTGTLKPLIGQSVDTSILVNNEEGQTLNVKDIKISKLRTNSFMESSGQPSEREFQGASAMHSRKNSFMAKSGDDSLQSPLTIIQSSLGKAASNTSIDRNAASKKAIKYLLQRAQDIASYAPSRANSIDLDDTSRNTSVEIPKSRKMFHISVNQGIDYPIMPTRHHQLTSQKSLNISSPLDVDQSLQLDGEHYPVISKDNEQVLIQDMYESLWANVPPMRRVKLLDHVRSQTHKKKGMEGRLRKDDFNIKMEDEAASYFEDFKSFVKDYIDKHKVCGENCRHLTRFYQKLNWYPAHHQRASLNVHTQTINRLPKIRKRKY
eukprot:TRINITY_DN9647_c0_g2_i2.p1 TRINITY_DN9647_c0_g2~~TRINITY_DN9647_c0_g2_i2.p1  ORF type:complete len:645 (+),score=87.61 TRINITY_DN9647_c0_g2_i2:63-1937(+)